MPRTRPASCMYVRNRAVIAAAATAIAATASPAWAELKVTVTIKPVHALVAQVMEGVGTPSLLVQGAASPHTYALKPSDAKALNKADVFFRVSESVEPFTRKIVAALPKSVHTVTLADAPGIELLDVRTGDTFEKHDHAHEHGHEDHDDDHDKHAKAGHDHHEKAGEAHDDHDDHEHETRDGHVWLDPQNARKMITEIARVLSEASPPTRTSSKRTPSARAKPSTRCKPRSPASWSPSKASPTSSSTTPISISSAASGSPQ